MVARLMAADARAVLSGLQPKKRRLMPEQMPSGVERVEAKSHAHWKISEHGSVGRHRYISQGAPLP
jgi:hypothetical protein